MKYINNLKCTGCGACVSACPVTAIKMKTKNGFMYPIINEEKCRQCGLCTQVCPTEKNHQPNICEYFIVQNRNKKQRLNSQSGGLFSALAQEIIRGGYLFWCDFG